MTNNTQPVSLNYDVYINYFKNTLKLTDHEFTLAMQAVLNRGQDTVFSECIAEKIVYDLRKKKHSLCIIVPTYKREKRVETWLHEKAKEYYIHGIDVLFVDSADNNHVEKIIKNYNFENIFYEKYDENSKTITDTIDEKVSYCFNIIEDKYDAIWPCHDVAMPNIDAFYEDFIAAMEENLDLLVYYPFHVNNDYYYKKSYDNSHDFILEQYGAMTSLSSVIYSKRIATLISQKYPVIRGVNDGLWLPTVIFHAIANINFCAKYIEKPNIFSYIPDNGTSFWLKNKSVMKLYTERWPNIVKHLPESYDTIREDILYNGFKKVNFNDVFLIVCRASGNFTLLEVLKNFRYLRKLMKTQFPLVLALSLFPSKVSQKYYHKDNIMVKILKETHRFLKRIL